MNQEDLGRLPLVEQRHVRDPLQTGMLLKNFSLLVAFYISHTAEQFGELREVANKGIGSSAKTKEKCSDATSG